MEIETDVVEDISEEEETEKSVLNVTGKFSKLSCIKSADNSSEKSVKNSADISFEKLAEKSTSETLNIKCDQCDYTNPH